MFKRFSYMFKSCNAKAAKHCKHRLTTAGNSKQQLLMNSQLNITCCKRELNPSSNIRHKRDGTNDRQCKRYKMRTAQVQHLHSTAHLHWGWAMPINSTTVKYCDIE